MEKITTCLYSLGGLVIDSELPLVGLPEVFNQAKNVSIRVGTPPLVERDALEIEPGCLANAFEYWHTFPGVAAFYVRGGEQIVVQCLDEDRGDELRSFLFSVIFAVLFFRRGLLPLHASAINIEGRVFAFLGRSGAGKSSLAAHLRQRGYQVIADDLTLLNPVSSGVTKVTPCAPWLKLWQDVIADLGEPDNSWEPIGGKEFKYRLPLAEKAANSASPMTLAGLFLLETGPFEEVALVPLTPAASVAKLMLYAYPILLVHKLGGNSELFRRCAEILEHVPMWTFSRPWSLQQFDKGLDFLEEHFTSIRSK